MGMGAAQPVKKNIITREYMKNFTAENKVLDINISFPLKISVWIDNDELN